MQTKRTFVKLQTLASLWTDDASWQGNVRSTGVAMGLTIATDNEDCNPVTQEFTADELELAAFEVQMYDFAGSVDEPERFFARDEMIYVDKATGNYWAKDSEELYEF